MMRLEDFDIAGEISKGSFGIVYKAVRKSDGRVFALKQVKLEGMKKVDREEAIDEARVLAQLNHPHITKHFDSWIDKDNTLNIVMELASRGNLSQLIKANKGKGLPEDLIWKFLIQSLMGLNHIHGKKIIHRDIKALNLFLDANDNIKIGDLGIARALSDGSAFARSLVGTPYYYSPELCEDKPYNEKSDMWALGVVMYECCMGQFPFDAQNEGALIRKILKGAYTPITGPYTASLIQLVQSLLTFNPNQRPDTNQLLKNPSITSKARALGIDLNPKVVGSMEDVPTYESRQQQQAIPASPSGMRASYMNYPPYNMAAAGGQQQQQQHPFAQQQQQRPAAGARPSPAAAHPFEPPRQQQYPQQQQQQQRPRQGVALQHPFALEPQGDQNQWDRMADELERMRIGTEEFHRLQQDRIAGHQANAHKAQRAQAKDLLQPGGYEETPPRRGPGPEMLPPAGHMPDMSNRTVPFALHYAQIPTQTVAQQQSSAVWTAKYSPPQYGRKRATDLMITGPSLRANSQGRPNSARAGGGYYARAADDATTYVSSTTYNGYGR
ncbi:hypothetical protein CEUSTIGMA_g900.t1 [Chlamydomonas eustigma]|uniref:non-specific serine/threonine protein kinase n=1 Tax=Chlamydomonas eustigma TaxID=1157962 RepID=A0A250WRJ3_9CHLO|nr:hypothetical protein CEUSTIGMA_g900.t1 [Chlamydomonas eustigma]|eukprot:GAX73448.1 hypothetical protein CEUSTIGMA_g900.t1 [Chlamydomonas eustigma]